jgi:alkanesulfonate monooxygenase SsuD/methylene tetrahydromethanopterin reductase-like flavin-dependent oxidoreductase (luciferase family)
VADPSKVRRIDHEGDFFKVMGPLPCAPSPQGRPVQIQAGSSPSGIKLAGRWADYQFATSGSLEGDIKARQRLDEAAVAAGRSPRDLGVLWARGFDVVSGPEEAEDHRQKLLASIPDQMAMVFLSQWWGLDGYRLNPDRTVHETIAEVKDRGVGPNWSYIDNAVAHSAPTTTIREYAQNWMGVDHGWIGTAEQIADWMEEEHAKLGANGGFMVNARTGAPGGFERFVREVIPILQHRGLYKTEYEGKTMRENLCLY